jgi:hypothetical protein
VDGCIIDEVLLTIVIKYMQQDAKIQNSMELVIAKVVTLASSLIPLQFTVMCFFICTKFQEMK